MKDPYTVTAWSHIRPPAVLLSVSVSPLFPLVSSREKTRGRQIRDGGDKWNWVQSVQAKDISASVSYSLSLSLLLSISVSLTLSPLCVLNCVKFSLSKSFSLNKSQSRDRWWQHILNIWRHWTLAPNIYKTSTKCVDESSYLMSL